MLASKHYEHDKLRAQLSRKKIYSLGAQILNKLRGYKSFFDSTEHAIYHAHNV